MKIPNKPLLDDHLTITTAPEKLYSQHWLVAIFVATALLGMLSAYFRPYFNINGVHWEAIVSIVVLVTLNVVGLMLISTDKRKHYARFYSILTLLLWMGYVIGWSIVDGDFMEDLIGVCAMTAIVAILIGMLVFAYQKRKER
ncbi:MAG: hypothetical protein AB8E82_09925 [Aureispira sp.]